MKSIFYSQPYSKNMKYIHLTHQDKGLKDISRKKLSLSKFHIHSCIVYIKVLLNMYLIHRHYKLKSQYIIDN